MSEDNIEQRTINTKNTLDPKVSALLSYLLGLVGGIVFFAISKDNYVRFHAMQSILFNVAAAILIALVNVFGFVLWFLLGIITGLAWLAIVGLWVLLMIKAYQGERFKLPVLGELAEKYAR